MPAITWTLLPATQTVGINEDAVLTDAWLGGVGSLQDFTFDDGAHGGVFTPASQSGVNSPSSLLYHNATPGTYTITVTPGTGPLILETPRTAMVVVTPYVWEDLTNYVQPADKVSVIPY